MGRKTLHKQTKQCMRSLVKEQINAIDKARLTLFKVTALSLHIINCAVTLHNISYSTEKFHSARTLMATCWSLCHGYQYMWLQDVYCMQLFPLNLMKVCIELNK